jgi:hypothetical protein
MVGFKDYQNFETEGVFITTELSIYKTRRLPWDFTLKNSPSDKK